MIDSLSFAVHALSVRMLTSLSIDEILLPSYVNWSTDFSGLLREVEIGPCYLKYMNSVLFAFT